MNVKTTYSNSVGKTARTVTQSFEEMERIVDAYEKAQKEIVATDKRRVSTLKTLQTQ